MNKFYILSILVILVGAYFLFAQNAGEKFAEEKKEELIPDADNIVTSPDTNMIAIMQTNFGEIKLELFSSDAPKTVENFVNLVKEGFYDGTKFHRVIKDFMIQGGDPFTKDNSLKDRWGSGGPGYAFADEIHLNNHNVIGTISMANAGPNTNGSQFFINTNDNNSLDTKHTVFGKVIDGLNVVRKIENVATEGPDRPINDVIIESIKIIEN
jgi:cyclophilin family peptidyl-prolyl cis-trans isomerase